MIDDRRAYRELAIQNRGGWGGDAGFLNIDDNSVIDLVGLANQVGIISAITEADDIELNRRQ